MTDQLDAIKAQISDLSTKVQLATATKSRPQPVTPAQTAKQTPFWEATIAASLTLTEGISDDWDPRFDDTTVATNRVKFCVGTYAGELNYQYIGPTAFRRFKLAWNADVSETITARLSGTRQDDGAGGYIQIKFNGVLNEYSLDSPGAGTTEYILSMTTKPGPNQLVICSQYRPFSTIFEAKLFGDGQASFTDPRGLNAYVRS